MEKQKMVRTEYQSGLWSERVGATLTVGKGGKTEKRWYKATDTIDDLLPIMREAVLKAGHNPDLFCQVGTSIVAKSLIPEIEACIAHARAESAARDAADKVEFEAAVASGEAFRVAEIADQYDSVLHWARRSKPGDGYADWVILGFSGSPRIVVEQAAILQVVAGRNSCGQFPGCSNRAWEISAAEWDQIVELSAAIRARRAAQKKEFDAATAAEDALKINTGYCYSCESYCYGDCGHYSSDPGVKLRRDIALAQREENYGINDVC